MLFWMHRVGEPRDPGLGFEQEICALVIRQVLKHRTMRLAAQLMLSPRLDYLLYQLVLCSSCLSALVLLVFGGVTCYCCVARTC